MNALAEIVNMSPSGFCKFFKKHTRKTFSHVLNEMRIGHACKLILEEELPITRVCYQSGYNSMSHFNRQFKHITGSTPLKYRKRFLGTGTAHN